MLCEEPLPICAVWIVIPSKVLVAAGADLVRRLIKKGSKLRGFHSEIFIASYGLDPLTELWQYSCTQLGPQYLQGQTYL